jgi:hypothetical protein
VNRQGSSARQQSGQALVFGLFVLIAGSAALFFFFNVGQLSREKTKLVNTADAVAYSAGMVHARALNFNAYANRALIANEVLIAQMVSLSSWSDYVASWAEELPIAHPECVQAASGNYWAAAASQVKYGPDYLVGCAALYWASAYGAIDAANGFLQDLIPAVVQVAEVNKGIIQTAQVALNLGLVVDRTNVMNAVADANYAGDGNVEVDEWTTPSTLPDDWVRMPTGNGRVSPFVHQYADDERTRFRETTLTAANTDPFVRQRNWTSTSAVPEPSCLPFNWRQNEVRRRGGTELLGFEEWQAVDTQSWHSNYRGKRPWNCSRRETPTGEGEQQAYNEDQDPGSAPFGRSRTDNPRAHLGAVSRSAGSGMGYSGLPDYFDLNQIWINGARSTEAPRLLHGIRLTRNRSQLRTTDGTTGQVRTQPGSRIGAYNSAVAGDVVAAASTSEVFFERPLTQADNVFGAPLGRPRELGSLFNPYWQVRLVSTNAVGEWLRQGVTP